MTAIQLDTFLKTMSIIGVLLLVGTILRAKVKPLQTLFLPACVIGGFIGLLLGPRMLGILPFSEEVMATASNMPGRFFALIIAAMPMCATRLKKGELFKRFDAISIGIIITLISALQFAIGFLVNVVCNAVGAPVYAGYGAEMMVGFCGGHGTASTVGGIFEGLGQDYWEVAQGVAMTFSTIGMVFGILLGIIVLNLMARRGRTHYVKNPGALPIEMKVGLYQDKEGRPSAGELTTAGGSLDTLSLHLAYIFLAVGTGYLIHGFIKANQIPYLTSLSQWFWMLIAMYILWPVTRALGWDRYFDPNIKSRLQGCVTDFIVTAAIMSMPIALIAEYWLPLLVTSVLGFAVTVPVLLFLNSRFVQENWVEKSMGPLGMMTGDFITGVLMTRMVDPDFKSNAMEDFSIAYTLNTFYCVAMVAIIFPYVVANGAFSAFLFTGAHAAVLFVLLLMFGVWKKKQIGGEAA